MEIVAKRDGCKVWTPQFRGAFVNLMAAKQIKGSAQEANYGLMALFNKGEDLAVFKQAAGEAAKTEWGDKAADVMKHPKFKGPFKDQGDLVSERTGELYTGMTPGAVCIQFNSKESFGRPGILDAAGNEIIDASEVYSGAWFRATVNAYAWTHPTGGRGVSFGLLNVQKLRDDDRLGGGRDKAQNDFEPVTVVEETGADTSAEDLWA